MHPLPFFAGGGGGGGTPPHICQKGGGGGRGVNLPPNFQKGGDLTGPQTLEGGLGGKIGSDFHGWLQLLHKR